MIVCHSRRFIFLHLHKTAGTSIKEALQSCLSEDDLVVGDPKLGLLSSENLDHSLRQLHKHSTAQNISQFVGEEIWNSYFKFCFVRNPFDRLVSLYEFFHRVRCNNSNQPGFLKRIFSGGQTDPRVNYPDRPPWNWPGMQALLATDDFSGFIRSEHLFKDQGANPQAWSLTDQSGNLMVDFVGKFESISDDWQQICDRLGIQQTLSQANQSEKRFEDLGSYWNEDDLRYASERYREDLTMFGYTPDALH